MSSNGDAIAGARRRRMSYASLARWRMIGHMPSGSARRSRRMIAAAGESAATKTSAAQHNAAVGRVDQSSGGATVALWPLRLSASATKPVAFISSTKARR